MGDSPPARLVSIYPGGGDEVASAGARRRRRLRRQYEGGGGIAAAVAAAAAVWWWQRQRGGGGSWRCRWRLARGGSMVVVAAPRRRRQLCGSEAPNDATISQLCNIGKVCNIGKLLGEILKQWRFWFDSIGDIRIWMRKTVSLAKMNILVRDYFSINRCNEAETSQ